jgi:tetraacyldisaccharide 4'-kinase
MNRKLQEILLFPLALVYGPVIRIRNFLFDAGILKSTTFAMPVITVGNLTVGGTGKTPHVEYLVNLLKDKYDLAVLSRGYKRKTRSFLFVETDADVSTCGDEPLQIKHKHPYITVAVDRNRVHGVNEILSRKPTTDIVLLDDAFQHRYIKAGLSILLINYNRLIFHDYMLPAGRLREHRSSVKRADIVLITKSPDEIAPDTMKNISRKIPLNHLQRLYYTSLSYDQPARIFYPGKTGINMDRVCDEMENILLVTGIAEPAPLLDYLNKYNLKVTHLKYPDHHHYTNKDLKKIKDKYLALPEGKRCLITTEKDAIRLRESMNEKDLPDNNLFYLRINIIFLNNEADEFNKLILDYVRENRRNSNFP